jgi:hypothetical protein
MISAAMKWMILTTTFIGKDKTKWGKVTSSTHSIQMAKYYDKITWDYWLALEATTPYETRNSLMTDEILNKTAQPQK